MKTVLVIAPHADDESLGCGGSILKHLADGDKVHWLLVTNMSVEAGYTEEQVTNRQNVIQQVGKLYGINQLHQLDFYPAQLDSVAKKDLISPIAEKIELIQPNCIYVPYRNDAHSDHEAVFDATMSVTKSFRCPFVKRILAYETLSETEFGLKPEDPGFKPNVFRNISRYLTHKLDILRSYSDELGEHPFPRSLKSVEALAVLRGAQSGFEAAEAFMLLKEIED